MKYDFSTYLKQTLNEKDDISQKPEKPKTFKEALMEVDDKQSLLDLLKNVDFNSTNTSITYNGVKYNKAEATKLLKSVLDDDDFKKLLDDNKTDIHLKNEDKDKNAKSGFLKFTDEIRKQLKSGKSNYRKSKQDFEKLGEAIVFRTACSFSKNVDDFSKICKQIFENDSDDRIKSLTTIETQMGEYGAIKGFEEYKEKNEKTNDDEAKSILDRCEPFYQKLMDQSTPDVEVLDAIDQISASIPQEFKKFYEEAQGAFEQGRENMNKNIKDPNFKWEDPITGKKAEGVDNIKAGMQKLANNLGTKADELGKKIMSSPHNLENDMMKVGVIALKVMLGGVKGIRKIADFFGFGKRSASADAFIKGCKDSRSSIKTLLDKFGSFLSKNVNLWKAFKNISNKSDSKSSGEGINASYEMSFGDYILNEETKPADGQPTEEKKEEKKPEEKKDNFQEARDKFFNDPAGFKNTGYHILDYITKNVCYLIKLANSDDLKICKIEKLENSDNTYGLTFTKSGSMTMVQDKLNLYIKSLQFYIDFCDTIEKNIKGINDKLYLGDLMATANVFDFNRTQLMRSCDKILNNEDFKQNEKLKKNIEAIKTLYNEKEGFAQITQDLLKITKDPKGFSSGGTSLTKFKAGVKQTIDRLSKLKIEPLAEAATVKFETEDDFNKFTKDLTKAFGGNFEPFKSEEEESSTNNSIKTQYEEVQKTLDELKDVNKLEDVASKFETMDSNLNSAVKSVEEMIAKLPDDDERKTAAENIKIDKNSTIGKIVYVKAAMKALKLTESVAINNILKLLTEAEGTPDVKAMIDELKKVLSSPITDENTPEKMIEKANAITKKAEEYFNKMKDTTKQNLEKYKDSPFKLLYAINSLLGGEKKDEKKPDAPAEAKKDAELLGKMFAALGEHLKDTDLMKLITTVEEQNKKLTKDLQNYLDEPGVQTQFKEYVSKLGKYSNQILPAYWVKKTIIGLHESFWYNKRLLDLLNEAENEGEEKTTETQQTENKDDLTKKTEFLFDKSLEELCNCVNVGDFLPKYEKWVENVNNLVEEIKKANNEEINKKLDELKNDDPLKLAAACARAIETLGGKKEEKKPEEQPQAEGGAKSEESEETKKS